MALTNDNIVLQDSNCPSVPFVDQKFGQYPEYHTSADDFSVVTEQGLQGAFAVMKVIVDAFETCLYPLVCTKCEPQLGKRGLYPEVSQKSDKRKPVRNRMDILCYCNGKNSIFEISRFTNIKLVDVVSELSILVKSGLVRENKK